MRLSQLYALIRSVVRIYCICFRRYFPSCKRCSHGRSYSTGNPSSSCEMISLRNNSHGGIIRVCMGICTTALRNEQIRQFLNKNTSPYFHSVLLVIWPLTLMKRAHLSELFISRFSTYIRKALFTWSNLEKSGSCENCRYHLWGVTANHTFQNWIQSTRDFEARVQISLISIAPHLHQITVNIKGRFANHN